MEPRPLLRYWKRMPNKAWVVINPATAEAWQQEIGAGEHIIGRGPENQVSIDHPSVDLAHCSLRVENGGAILTDLGSQTGTFVSGQQVDKVSLTPGTRFRIGQIELEFAVSPPHRLTASQPHRLKTSCRKHPQALARHYCAKCEEAFCELCVQTRRTRKICRKCGTGCQQLRVRPVPETRPTFWKLLPAAFSYPFRGNGLFVMIAGVLVYLVVGWLPLMGLLVAGYMFNYCKQIVATSAAGQPEAPDWPDFTEWGETIIIPYFHLFALVAVSFGPAILLAAFLPWEDWRRYVLVGGAAAFGAFLAPMGMLALAMFDTVTVLNPVTLLWSIARIFKEYIIAAIVFEVTLLVSVFSDQLIHTLLPIPVLPLIASAFASYYLLCLAMRIIGLLHWSCEDRLQWNAH